jgi:peroxin-2
VAYTQKLTFLQTESAAVQRYSDISEMECAICLDRSTTRTSSKGSRETSSHHPIQTPYVTSCGHLFCYFCVSEKVLQAAEEGSYWECLRCSQPVYNILREQAEAEDSDDEERVIEMGRL